MDGVQATLFLSQISLFVHVGSSHQLDSQAEALFLGQMESL